MEKPETDEAHLLLIAETCLSAYRRMHDAEFMAAIGESGGIGTVILGFSPNSGDIGTTPSRRVADHMALAGYVELLRSKIKGYWDRLTQGEPALEGFGLLPQERQFLLVLCLTMLDRPSFFKYTVPAFGPNALPPEALYSGFTAAIPRLFELMGLQERFVCGEGPDAMTRAREEILKRAKAAKDLFAAPPEGTA
jgi:hypothetical protein